MDGAGLGIAALILSGTVAFVSTAGDGGVTEWRGKRTLDNCPASILGGCRDDDGPVTFHIARAR